MAEEKRKTAHQQRIEEFMGKAGQAVPNEPLIPDEETRILRAKLILEEALETIEALGVTVGLQTDPYIEANKIEYYDILISENSPKPNLQEIADGCADISVVTIGTLSACGIADKPLLEEVDRSNLTKFGPGGYRRPDGKWVKPPEWKPPNIKKAIYGEDDTDAKGHAQSHH